MNHDYYSKEIKPLSIAHFKEKWSKYLDKNGVEIRVPVNYLDKVFITQLKSLKEVEHINISLKEQVPKDLMQECQEGNCDVIPVAYIGNFPDPDGFIEPLESEKRGYKLPVTELKNALKNIQSTEIKERISIYSKELFQFEGQSWIIPLFRLKLPIIHHERIGFPDTHLKYETELWKIFWRK